MTREPGTTAERFLLDVLADGEVPAVEVQAAARAEGIAKNTLERAKQRLGVISLREGRKGRWWWVLDGSGDLARQQPHSDVLAFDPRRRTNGELIAAVTRLGYIDGTVIDPTYGRGGFWTIHRPPRLIAFDLDPRCGVPVADFRALPLTGRCGDTAVFDPPYKLNGTPAHGSDERYGVAGTYVRREDRHTLARDGITECVRILRPGGHLLVKCQDQVSSQEVRWQTTEFIAHAESLGCRLIDRLHLQGMRPQPGNRRQRHARNNYSTLLVLCREGP